LRDQLIAFQFDPERDVSAGEVSEIVGSFGNARPSVRIWRY